MRMVYKYSLTEQLPWIGRLQTMALPKGATALHFDAGGGMPGLHLWVLVDPTEPLLVERHFIVVGTGQKLPQHGAAMHVASCVDGAYVWHCFEIVSAEG
jgi:hypothetical protein